MRNVLLVGAVLVVAQGASAHPMKQPTIVCPPNFESYCGGWTVTKFFLQDPEADPHDHLKRMHRFVIGRKGQSVWLFPRNDLSDDWRWGTMVELEPKGEISGGVHRCLVGTVNIELGHTNVGSGGQGEEHGPEHDLIIRVVPDTTSEEIGEERQLRLYIFEPPSDPEDPSAPKDPCAPPSEDRHLGEAHAED